MMGSDWQSRLESEYQSCKHRLKRPADLLSRKLSDQDWLDAAVVGGVSVSDVIAGKIHEWEIPDSVKTAFHDQYPNLHEGFTAAVQRLAGEPESLRGLVAGVRGKLFEINYVDYLNHGHLPDGLTAHLAHSSTNPAWDISIIDSHRHVTELLQMKASAGIRAAHEAISQHPDVDVVIPHDVLATVGSHSDIASHLVDGHDTLAHLNDTMDLSVSHAELAASHFHVPYLSFLVTVGTTYMSYRTGRISAQEALASIAQRVFASTAASAIGWTVGAFFHKTIIGIPVGFCARRQIGKYFKSRDQLKAIDRQVTVIVGSRRKLSARINRQTLLLPNPVYETVQLTRSLHL